MTGLSRLHRKLWSGPRKFHLEFIFPNLWQNYLGEKVRIFVAFVPVDESNTPVSAVLPGVCHRAGHPVGRQLAGYADRPVGPAPGQARGIEPTTHQDGAAHGEKLVQGDAPIIAFRRKREELQCGPLGLLA